MDVLYILTRHIVISIGSELDEAARAAIFHLREQSPFVRVLGSYPRGGRLVGPVKAVLDQVEMACLIRMGHLNHYE